MQYRLLLIAVAASPIVSTTARAQSADALPPVVARLAADLAASRNRDSTLAWFWRDIARQGTPLVGAAATTGTASVTFLWRGAGDTRNVVVITPLALQDIASSVMHRLPDTDVWYLAVRIRTDAMWTYRFSVDDNLIPFDRDPNPGARLRALRRDPLNPAGFDFGTFGIASVVILPDAPRDWSSARPSVPHGTVDSLDLPDAGTGTRRVWVYTPPGYPASTTRFPLLVATDGASYLRLMHLPATLDNLIAAGRIRPIIAVLVDNPGASRGRDLDCRAEWGSYLAAGVLPALRRRYRLSARGADVVLAGYSLGGLAAACAAIEHPTAFGGVIAQSGSFYRASGHNAEPEAVARRLARMPRLDLRWNLSIGTHEVAAIPSRDPSMLTASRHLRDVLTARGYRVVLREFTAGHEFVAWQRTIALALEDQFGPGAPAAGPH